MKMQKLKLVKTPDRGTKLSAGIDFYIPEFTDTFLRDFLLKNSLPINLDKKVIEVGPGDIVNIPSGIRCEVPKNHVLISFNKSGIASKLKMDVMACVIDEDYRGELHISLINNGNTIIELNEGMKATQFLLLPINYCNIEIVDDISIITERAEKGFGSTNNKKDA